MPVKRNIYCNARNCNVVKLYPAISKYIMLFVYRHLLSVAKGKIKHTIEILLKYIYKKNQKHTNKVFIYSNILKGEYKIACRTYRTRLKTNPYNNDCDNNNTVVDNE